MQQWLQFSQRLLHPRLPKRLLHQYQWKLLFMRPHLRRLQQPFALHILQPRPVPLLQPHPQHDNLCNCMPDHLLRRPLRLVLQMPFYLRFLPQLYQLHLLQKRLQSGQLNVRRLYHQHLRLQLRRMQWRSMLSMQFPPDAPDKLDRWNRLMSRYLP